MKKESRSPALTYEAYCRVHLGLYGEVADLSQEQYEALSEAAKNEIFDFPHEVPEFTYEDYCEVHQITYNQEAPYSQEQFEQMTKESKQGFFEQAFNEPVIYW